MAGKLDQPAQGSGISFPNHSTRPQLRTHDGEQTRPQCGSHGALPQGREALPSHMRVSRPPTIIPHHEGHINLLTYPLVSSEFGYRVSVFEKGSSQAQTDVWRPRQVFPQEKGEHKSINGMCKNTQSSFTANSSTLETQMPINRRIRHKLWYIHMVEYYTAMKKSKLFSRPIMWTNHTDPE